jgi:hypothetical protein
MRAVSPGFVNAFLYLPNILRISRSRVTLTWVLHQTGIRLILREEQKIGNGMDGKRGKMQ